MVEKGGQGITSGIQGPRRWGNVYDGCQYLLKCNVRKDKDCRVGRCVYKVVCKTCQDYPITLKEVVHIGTSGFSLHKRLVEHMADVRTGALRNAMAKHQQAAHDNPQGAVFEGEALEGQNCFNLEGFVSEALEIQMAKDDPNVHLMNQRGEWGHYGITRLQIVTER